MKQIKKKTKKKLIIWTTVLAILVAVTVWQLFFSYSVCSVVVKTDIYEQAELERETEYYADNPLDFSDIQLSSEPFPSIDSEDYIYLYICPIFRNTGILSLTFSEAYIEKVGNGDDTIIYYRDLTNCDKVSAFSKGEGGCFSALIYRKGLTDEEILTALKEYKITMYASNALFHELKFEIPLEDCKMSIKPLR